MNVQLPSSTKSKVRVIFFGSTDDSVIVLNNLNQQSTIQQYNNITISAVVTQPPRPVGRKQIMTPTPVETWAKDNRIPVLSFPSNPDKPTLYADEQTVIDTLEPFQADLLVSASYGQKIPTKTISDATYGGLNVHPSILPRWRGADPVPWAILSGDHQTGVTVVTLSAEFDQGEIIAQKKIPITAHDTSDPLRTRLFAMGADLLISSLPDRLNKKGDALQGEVLQGVARKKMVTPYARRLTREDGFEPWESIEKALVDAGEAARIDRKYRAFTPWPGVWTNITIQREQQIDKLTKQQNEEEKRLKILACHLSSDNQRLMIDTVQLEGKQPVAFSQFAQAYLPEKTP